jgi:hypothetical protein
LQEFKGYSGDGALATLGTFRIPVNLHGDIYGNIFVADSANKVHH